MKGNKKPTAETVDSIELITKSSINYYILSYLKSQKVGGN